MQNGVLNISYTSIKNYRDVCFDGEWYACTCFCTIRVLLDEISEGVMTSIKLAYFDQCKDKTTF